MSFRTLDPLASLEPDKGDEDWLESGPSTPRKQKQRLAKAIYDKHHPPLVLQPGDEVLLRSHNGYTLPPVKSTKLSIWRVGPCRIVGKKGNLA